MLTFESGTEHLGIFNKIMTVQFFNHLKKFCFIFTVTVELNNADHTFIKISSMPVSSILKLKMSFCETEIKACNSF